jgi:hypothetical protein
MLFAWMIVLKRICFKIHGYIDFKAW